MIRAEAIHLPFRYAAGLAGSRSLAALRDAGQILGSRCPHCEQVHCPASSWCPRCSEDTPELVPVGPEGRLVTWTALPGRGAFGLVQPDGADTALLQRLLGPQAGWTVGLRVRARFAQERCGSVLDLEGFEPVKEPSP